MADETRDISNQEQLSICIRWIDSEFSIHDDLIGMVHVEKTDATSISTAIKDVLFRCSLSISQWRGQGYDGCSVMMRHLTGVATQLRQIEPAALQVHCFAHSLNLCLQDAAKLCTIVRDCLGLVGEMILYSPKRSLVFDKCQKEFSPEAPGLRPLCPTRWTVRTSALDSILKNYETLIHAFRDVNTTSHDDYGR